MKKTKLFALIMAATLLFCMIPFANAATTQYEIISTETIDLGDDCTLEVTTYKVTSPLTRASSETTDYLKSCKAKYGSTVVGVISLWGEFSYNGTSAKAIDSDCHATAKSGYDYKNCKSSYSGATVKGSCTFYNDSFSKNYNAAMTCDKNGNIS